MINMMLHAFMNTPCNHVTIISIYACDNYQEQQQTISIHLQKPTIDKSIHIQFVIRSSRRLLPSGISVISLSRDHANQSGLA